MSLAPVHHRRINVDGVDTFYREAGPADAPVVLLPHGYPMFVVRLPQPHGRTRRPLALHSAGHARIRLQRNTFR
jgi:pimeloyl-ACP methyl ester carboxylesterase